jgi:hypothetical protein
MTRGKINSYKAMKSSFTIDFDFRVDNGRFKIRLRADIELQGSTGFYLVKNFRIEGREGPAVIPDVLLRKAEGQWVHTDSGKTSDLSVVIGQAIERVVQGERGEKMTL